MDYTTYQPHDDLASLIKYYWTLEVPAGAQAGKQRIVPDGCIEMAFILGDDIRRYTSDNDALIQPRAMVLGQITEPFYIEPTGRVDTFAVRFYPYGFANFITAPLAELANKETPLDALFEPSVAAELQHMITTAPTTAARIQIIEDFLMARLQDKHFIDDTVRQVIDTLLLTRGTTSVKTALKNESSRRRQLERKFQAQIGISPKQLSKVMRLQAALKMMTDQPSELLTTVAYEGNYYDQSHFIKDFKEFTGTTPAEFLADQEMALASLFST
jgi:AraC-like DNA-binding protein